MDVFHDIDPSELARYLVAGNANFMLESTATGTQFCYKIQHVWTQDGWDYTSPLFIKLQRGDRYIYMGVLNTQPFSIRLTAKSVTDTNNPAYKAINYIIQSLNAHKLPAGVNVYYNGRCGRCGKELLDAEHQRTGVCCG